MNHLSLIFLMVVGLLLISICETPNSPQIKIARTAATKRCELQHIVGQGETQWMIASRYAGPYNKHLWLRHMRYSSYLASDDIHIHPGQVLCVVW